MNRVVSISIAVACALSIFTMSGCSGPQNTKGDATPPQTVDCTKSPTDAEIVSGVYTWLEYKGYAVQEWQFNITANSAAKTVKIVGWSPQRGQIIPEIETAVNKTCSVDPTGFVSDKPNLLQNNQMRVGCPTGTGPCGDICVPLGDSCKILGTTHVGSALPQFACPMPTPTPTP